MLNRVVVVVVVVVVIVVVVAVVIVEWNDLLIPKILPCMGIGIEERDTLFGTLVASFP